MNIHALYGESADTQSIYARYNELTERFHQATGKYPGYLFSSSGRAEVLGNHTDHNGGKVIVSAISCDIIAAVSKRYDGMVELHSVGFSPIRFRLKDVHVPQQRECGKSIALVKGVLKALSDRGYPIGGFTAYTASNIFRGAGVSSSAAFEVLIAEIQNALYLNGALSPFEKAIIGQYAENVYFGKPCGLLDQSGIALGGMNAIDFSSLKNPIAKALQPPAGYSIVITNTGGSHASLTDCYADIKSEMKSVARYFGKDILGEVASDVFFDSIPDLAKTVSERAILRAMHFYEENDRVDRAANALQAGNTDGFLSLVEASGESSCRLLQNYFVPGSTAQPVLLGVELARRYLKNGAVRIHGGGFAGTLMAFAENSEVPAFRLKMARVFGEDNVFVASLRQHGTTMLTENDPLS